MKEFCGIVRPGDFDTYVKDGVSWEALLCQEITGDPNNGGGRLTLGAGKALPPFVRPDMEELWVVLSGNCCFSVWSEDGKECETQELASRDLVYLRKGQKREVANCGQEPAVFMVYFPQSGPEKSFLQGDDVYVIPAKSLGAEV